MSPILLSDFPGSCGGSATWLMMASSLGAMTVSVYCVRVLSYGLWTGDVDVDVKHVRVNPQFREEKKKKKKKKKRRDEKRVGNSKQQQLTPVTVN